MIVATTRAALLRGSAPVDSLGDEHDYNGPEVRHFETIPASYTPWIESRRNLFPNPEVVSAVGFIANGGQTTLAYVGAAARLTIDTAGVAGISVQAPATSGMLGRLLVRARASRPLTGALRLRATQAAPLVVGVAWDWYEMTATAGAGPVGQSGFLLASAAGHAPGDWIEIDRVLYADGAAVGPFFSGSTPNTDLVRSSWAGAINASASIEETRSVDVPQHDVWVVDQPSAFVPGFEDFPISIIERDGTEFDQASATWRSVRKLKGRVPANVPIDEGDRIKDLRDGKIYAVDNFRRTARGLSGRSSVTMNLRRTSP